PFSIAVSDFNGDSKQDLAVANHDSANVSILLRICGPTTTPTPTPTTTATPPPSPAQALNISTRMRVDTGNNVLIGGFIIPGTTPKSVAVRGIGPSLGAFGVPDVLADPTLGFHASSGALLFHNANLEDNPTQ